MSEVRPVQFDLLMQRLADTGRVTADDVEPMIDHLGRMRQALAPFMLLARSMPEGAGLQVGCAVVTADDLRAAVVAYDMMDQTIMSPETVA